MPSLSASKDHFCPSKCVRLSSRAAIFTFSTSYRDVTDTQAKCRMRMARSQHACTPALPAPFRISNPSRPLRSVGRGHLPGDHSQRRRKGRLFGFVAVRIPPWVRVTRTEAMVLPARRPAGLRPRDARSLPSRPPGLPRPGSGTSPPYRPPSPAISVPLALLCHAANGDII